MIEGGCVARSPGALAQYGRRRILVGGLGGSASARVAIEQLFTQRLPIGGRVPWTALFPGAAATMIGLLGLRISSRLVFSLSAGRATARARTAEGRKQ
ncbi:hypothetical protein [Streptomyces subrutilus]|uniref:hypothetical protein n=1 Tax=Streptomyces subrutilus TaxID=36818 RepID=UPI0034052F6B